MHGDATQYAIIAGLVVAAAFAFFSFYRHKTCNLTPLAVVFLAAFSVPAGAELIRVALSGDQTNLPHWWREYVAVAGVIAIGVALTHIFDAFKNMHTPQRANPVDTSHKSDDDQKFG